MATAGDFEKEVMSEEYPRHLPTPVICCDPCQDDDLQIEADKFCVECNDYLCSDCCTAHKKAKPSKTHVLKDKSEMPASKPPSTLTMTEKCPLHKTEAIKWYCISHDMTICDLCQRIHHDKCTEIKTITEMSSDIFDSCEFKTFIESLKSLKEGFGKNLMYLRDNFDESERIFNKAVRDITKVQDLFTNIRNKDREVLKSLESTCNASFQNLADILTDFETFQDGAVKEQAFLDKRNVETRLKLFEETMKLVADRNLITRYRFIPPKSLGNQRFMIMTCETQNCPVKLEDINVKTPSDKSSCCISGICRLDHNRLIVSDRDNNNIKLLNLITKSVCSELALSVQPKDIAKVDDENVVVTTYQDTILFVTVSDQLFVNRTIKNKCYGIIYDNGLLNVSCYGPGRIETLDLNGDVKGTIEGKCQDGTLRFGTVEYLVKRSDTFYLSDYSNEKIVSLTADGKGITGFSHKDLRKPRDITLGRDGRIFVCSTKTHKIFELSSDLTKGEIILDEESGIRYPYSIEYDDDENSLYVGSYNSNNIQVFLV